jgi:hypothetical protein
MGSDFIDNHVGYLEFGPRQDDIHIIAEIHEAYDKRSWVIGGVRGKLTVNL